MGVTPSRCRCNGSSIVTAFSLPSVGLVVDDAAASSILLLANSYKNNN
jgi:hypothetical protein